MAEKTASVEALISRYREELERLGIEVEQVILYGSHARGEAKRHSDIDLAVVSPTFEKMDIFERQVALSRAHHKFRVPIEPVGFSSRQARERSGFAREVFESGIVIYRREAKRGSLRSKPVGSGRQRG